MCTGKGTLKTPACRFGRSPKIKGSIGVLIGQRVKHFGIVFAIEGEALWHCFCHRFENTRKAATSGLDADMRSITIKIALLFTQPCLRSILLTTYYLLTPLMKKAKKLHLYLRISSLHSGSSSPAVRSFTPESPG